MEHQIIKFPNSGETVLAVHLVFEFAKGVKIENAETLCAILERARLAIDGETIATVYGSDLHEFWCKVPDPHMNKPDPFSLPLPVIPKSGIRLAPERDVRLYIILAENAPNLVNIRGNFYTSGPA